MLLKHSCDFRLNFSQFGWVDFSPLGKSSQTQETLPNRLKLNRKSQECFNNMLREFQEILLNLKEEIFSQLSKSPQNMSLGFLCFNFKDYFCWISVLNYMYFKSIMSVIILLSVLPN